MKKEPIFDATDEELTRMNFEVSKSLRNSFKAKVASKGENMKEVFSKFMLEYVENN